MTIIADRSELTGGLEQGGSSSAGVLEWPADGGAIGRAEEDRLDWMENQAHCRAAAKPAGRWTLAALSVASLAGVGCAAAALLT